MNFKQLQIRINKIKGNYTVKSPYHKRKRLPFNIIGHNIGYIEFPVRVNTVEYKGWKCYDIFTNYSLEILETWIKEGKLKKVKEQEKTQISMWG